MNKTIVKSILGVLRLIAPVASNLIDEIEKDMDAGTLTFEDVEALAQAALSVGENYWPKGADILADVSNLIPQVYKLITDCEHLNQPAQVGAAQAA